MSQCAPARTCRYFHDVTQKPESYKHMLVIHCMAFSAHFLALGSASWSVKMLVFYRVGLLNPCPTSSVDQHFVLGFTLLAGLACV